MEMAVKSEARRQCAGAAHAQTYECPREETTYVRTKIIGWLIKAVPTNGGLYRQLAN